MLEGMISISGTGQEYTDVQSFLVKLNSWMGEHYAIVALLQLPVAALGTFLAFLNRGYNYVEHFILNAFLTAQSLIMHIVLFPLTYIFNEKPALRTLTIIENVLSIALVVWVLLQFFSGYKKSSTFWRTMLSFIIYTFLYLVLFIVTGTIIYYVRKTGS